MPKMPRYFAKGFTHLQVRFGINQQQQDKPSLNTSTALKSTEQNVCENVVDQLLDQYDAIQIGTASHR